MDLEFLRFLVMADTSPESSFLPLITPPSGPPPKPDPRGTNHDPGIRLQALALVEAGMEPKIVEAFTGVRRSTISRLRKKARERGYNPEISRKLLIEYVIDGARSGRPGKQTS